MTVSLLLAALSIFLLRIADVSLGTLRITMLVRGQRGLAGGLGFLESLVWLVAAAQVLSSLDSPVKFVAYAGGYAVGTMLGATIERWLAMGNTLMRVITSVGAAPLADTLRDRGYRVTVVNASGRNGEVQINFSIIPRRHVPRVLKLIREIDPVAYVTLEATTPVQPAVPATRVRK